MSIKKAQDLIAYIEDVGGYDMRHLEWCAKADRKSIDSWLPIFIKHHEDVDADTAKRVANYYLYGDYPAYKKGKE